MTSLKLHPVWELARLLTALLMLVGCVDDGDPEDLASQTNAVKKKGITVSGHKVMRNGHRFISRGVIFEGFQFPKDAMEACEAPPQKAKDQDFCDRHLLAMDYVLNGDALDRAKQSWKANTVRFNVNQALLDPSSALHDKKDESGKKWGDKYLNLLDNAVQKARDKNMVVMIALFSGRLDRADKVYVDGKRLNPLVFDHKFYLQRYPDLAAAADASSMTKRDFAEKHWKDYGIKDGRMGSPTWDPLYYAAAHPDVAAAFGTSYYSMLNHFINGGRQAGYRASAAFDPVYYCNRYSDLQAEFNCDPAALLDHFVAYGLNEGRQASAELAPAWYLGTAPGLAASLEYASYHGAIVHFFRDGQPAGWAGSHP